MMSKQILNEIVRFLHEERHDLRSTACSTVAQLTGTDEGLSLVLGDESLLLALLKLIHDVRDDVTEETFKVLINITSKEKGSIALLDLPQDVISILVESVKNPNFSAADNACCVLANITSFPDLSSKTMDRLNNLPGAMSSLIDIVCHPKYNKMGSKLDMLTQVIANLTQCNQGRRLILDKDKRYFERLLPLIEYADTKERRKGVLSIIHNCCFEKNVHEWLLGEEVDLGTRLALPLSGPDCFSPEENDSLPLDLQYLADSKLREEFSDLRFLILETFLQLCATRKCREKLRDLNLYLVFREHHKWEKDEKCLALNEDVVNFLIRTEDEVGVDDLSTVDVPPDMAKKFTEFDQNFTEKESKNS